MVTDLPGWRVPTNHTFHSMETVETTLVQSRRRLKTHPDLVRSITSFPWIICS